MKLLKISIILFIWLTSVFAEKNQKISIKKSSVESTKYFDINRITCSIRNDGIFARHPITGNSDFRFDDQALVYASGFWIAAKVNGETRASVADFYSDWVGGAIDAQGSPYGKEDSTFRVYKISRGDNAANNPDYAQWPIDLGAPADGQGNPLLFGDQTLWSIFTDSYLENRKINIVPPLGAEVHLTVWGWQEIDNIMYLRWKIFNNSGQQWNDIYFGIFSDPDFGDARDDVTGSDSTLNLVFAYESAVDEFLKANHAVGYVMLESPAVPSVGDTALTFYGKIAGCKNVPVMAPKYRKNDSHFWDDIPYQYERTAGIIYNRMRGLDDNGNFTIDPTTGAPSSWAYSGDPIAGTGWIDDRPSDRRMMLSAGPFNMAPGDTNSIMIAIIPVHRHNRLACVYDLKQQARALQSMFRGSAGIYTEKVYALAGGSDVQFPIKLLNSSQVQKIEFYLELRSDDIEFVGVTPSGRAQDFLAMVDPDSTNRLIHVIMQATNKFISTGNDTIAYLMVNINPQPASPRAAIKFNDIKITDEFNNELRIGPVEGIIEIEQFPAAPRLLSPMDGYIADGLGIHFSWTHTEGSQPNIYVLNFSEPFYSESTTDTSISLAMREFVLWAEYPATVTWTAEIANYGQPILSPDTFRFELPSRDKLNFTTKLYTIQIPEETGYSESVVDNSYHPPFLYSFVHHRDNNTHQSIFRLFVFEIFDDTASVINVQDIDYDNMDAIFQLKDNEAFIYANGVLKTYRVNEDRKFTLERTINLNFSVREMQLWKDYLVFCSYSKILIYHVNSLTDIRKVYEYNISDWQIPDPGNPQHLYENMMVIKDDFLFLAQGDWGIFDISNPDSLYLIKRIEIPGQATTIDYENGFVVVGSADFGLGIYDVTSVTDPVLLHAEQYNDIGIGKSYNKIAKLKIIGGKIYFENWGLVGLQVCHYEPETFFKLDGMMDIYYPLISNRKIFSMRGNRITVYQNRLATSIAPNVIRKPLTFQLYQNYPNPFNHATQIHFSLNKAGNVKLTIFNIQGQRVRTLVNEFMALDAYKMSWDGTSQSGQPVASGLYFYQLKVAEQKVTKKMLLLR